MKTRRISWAFFVLGFALFCEFPVLASGTGTNCEYCPPQYQNDISISCYTFFDGAPSLGGGIVPDQPQIELSLGKSYWPNATVRMPACCNISKSDPVKTALVFAEQENLEAPFFYYNLNSYGGKKKCFNSQFDGHEEKINLPLWASPGKYYMGRFYRNAAGEPYGNPIYGFVPITLVAPGFDLKVSADLDLEDAKIFPGGSFQAKVKKIQNLGYENAMNVAVAILLSEDKGALKGGEPAPGGPLVLGVTYVSKIEGQSKVQNVTVPFTLPSNLESGKKYFFNVFAKALDNPDHEFDFSSNWAKKPEAVTFLPDIAMVEGSVVVGPICPGGPLRFRFDFKNQGNFKAEKGKVLVHVADNKEMKKKKFVGEVALTSAIPVEPSSGSLDSGDLFVSVPAYPEDPSFFQPGKKYFVKIEFEKEKDEAKTKNNDTQAQVALECPKLFEYRYSSASGAPPSVTETAFHNPQIVTPFVQLNAPQISEESITISGWALSTLDLYGESPVSPTLKSTSSPKVLVRVNGALVPLSGNGSFSHTFSRKETTTLVTASAFNELGGSSSAYQVIEGLVMTKSGQENLNPVFQKLVLGDSESFGWLVAKPYPQLELQLRTYWGALSDSILVGVYEDGGQIVTEPFLISEQGYLRNDAELAYRNRLLRFPVPSPDPGVSNSTVLDHNLYLRSEGNDLAVIPMTGIQVVSPPPFSLFAQMADSNLLHHQPLQIRFRNIKQPQLQLFNGLSEIPQDFTGSIGPLPDASQALLVTTDAIPFLTGGSRILINGFDVTGRHISTASPVFFLNQVPGASATAMSYSMSFDLDDPLVAAEIVKVEIKKDVPFDVIAKYTRYFGLEIAGVVDADIFDDCGNATAREVFVRPVHRDKGLALQGLKFFQEFGEILEEALPEEQLHMADELKNLGPADSFLGIYYDKDYSKGVTEATAEANNQRADAVWDTMNAGSGVANHYHVIDMRIDAPNSHFNSHFSSLKSLAFKQALELKDKPQIPLADIQAHPPDFLYGSQKYNVWRYHFRGVSQASSFQEPQASGSPPPRNGKKPTVRMEKSSLGWGVNGLSALKNQGILNSETEGVVLVVHGFNNETGTVDFEGLPGFPADPKVDTFTDSNRGDMPRAYWPFTRRIFYEFGLSPNILVLNVLWTGDWKPEQLPNATKPLFFNWDNALADYTGEQALAPLIRDLVVLKDGLETGAAKNNGVIDDPNWKGIALFAESLGNRTAVSAIGALDGLVDGSSMKAFPKIRYVMVHPALDQSGVGAGGTDAQKLSKLKTIGEKVLMFYSPFDKAGIAFKDAAGKSMLGRCGLPGSYNDATSPVQIRAFHNNADGATASFMDLWHVTVFGWLLPGMYFESRPTFDSNSSSSMLETLQSVLDTTDNPFAADLILHLKYEHLVPAWPQIIQYIHTGQIPN